MHRRKEKKHKYTKEDEDIYIAVEQNIRLIGLMHSLNFDEIQAFKTHALMLP